MVKNAEHCFVGQPIFAQILNLIEPTDFKRLVKLHKADRYYKSFKAWDHVVTMLFGIISLFDSMTEACKGLTGKLNYLNITKAPAKSSAGDGLKNRDNSFFEDLYYELV